MTNIKIKTLENFANLDLPYYATKHSAGLDLSAAIKEDIILAAGSFQSISTGLAIELPHNMEAQIRPRSGLAMKHGITILNAPGTIDADYRGEIKILLINHGKENFTITHGMRIAQMVIAKYEQVTFTPSSNLSDTDRGTDGFGSTGK